MICIVECVIDIPADHAQADPRPGWVRQMVGPFPGFDAAHAWMTAHKNDFDALIIHDLMEPLGEAPAQS